jgi:hypothetical protein
METMKRKNKVAAVKMEKMEGPGGKAVLQAARGVAGQGSTAEAGRQHMEGAQRCCGKGAKRGGRDALTLNQPVEEDGRMLRMESRQR